MDTTFSSYNEKFKFHQADSRYDEMQDMHVMFSTEEIKLADPEDMQLIAKELNEIPSKLFRYRMICDNQVNVLQQLEDEYKRWYAEKYNIIANEQEAKLDKDGKIVGHKKIERTETAKEYAILTRYAEEYDVFQKKLSREKYLLALVKTTVASIDSYSFKLHSILNYRQLLIQNKIDSF